MKRKYEVSYYEYGLTERITERFFLGFSALLFAAWARYRHGYESYVKIYEYEYEYE